MAGLAAHWRSKRQAALLLSSQLCSASYNYLVKRQMNGLIYSTGLFMSTGELGRGKGGRNVFHPPFSKGEGHSFRVTLLVRTARKLWQGFGSELSHLNKSCQLSI